MKTKFDVDDTVYVKARIVSITSHSKDTYVYGIKILNRDKYLDYFDEEELKEVEIEDESE